MHLFQMVSKNLRERLDGRGRESGTGLRRRYGYWKRDERVDQMETEEERQSYRRMRIEEMKKEKRRIVFWQRCMGVAVVAFAGLMGGLVGFGGASMFRGASAPEEQDAALQVKESGTGNVILPEQVKVSAVEPMSERYFQGSIPVAFLPDGEEIPAGDRFGVEEVPLWLMANGGSLSLKGLVPLEETGIGAPLFEACSTAATVGFDDSIISQYGVVIDVEDGVILAQKEAQERMNPASMTKILTVLVAAEHISQKELDETVTITIDITDYCYINGCSVTGYGLGETVTVRDLFYGTILPSGADSALALAIYVAGSHEAFVDMMNEKLAQMGMADTTHVTNCVGLYNEEHYSTVYDMARILKTAVDDPFCRDVLSEHIYTTSYTEQHPEGLRVSNKFLRNIEDLDTHGEVLCAKTGFVNQAGSCAASYCLGNDGREYLCVTAGSTSSKNCIADQAQLYRTFIPE